MGPAKVQLGKSADVEVPDGYKFMAGNGGRYFLQLLRIPTSRGFAGLMTSVDGKWLVIFDFVDVGYVKATKDSSIDADAALKVAEARCKSLNAERAKMAIPPISAVT